MEIYHFVNGQPPRLLAGLERLPDDGVIWADFERSQAQGWECWAEPLLGVAIEPQHVSDSLNPTHPSFFDGTPAYDMLVFEDLGPKDDPLSIETRTAAFFLFDRMLVTVRAVDNVSFGITKQKLAEGRLKSPGSVLGLAHTVLNTMVDRYLKIREPLGRHLSQLQEDLLDPDHPLNDWRALLHGRRAARRLEALCEDQLEALDAWRRGTRFEWGPHESVRIRDLSEHIERVLAVASDQERDIEAAVQLHFASMTHRTNEIVRTLTVFSAIFLPLSFVAGIFGMNFQHMPELYWHYGYYVALGFMALLGVGLLLYFKRRGYF